jgi:hypothetical protein
MHIIFLITTSTDTFTSSSNIAFYSLQGNLKVVMLTVCSVRMVTLKMCPFLGHGALELTRKHAARTNGVRANNRDF